MLDGFLLNALFLFNFPGLSGAGMSSPPRGPNECSGAVIMCGGAVRVKGDLIVSELQLTLKLSDF